MVYLFSAITWSILTNTETSLPLYCIPINMENYNFYRKAVPVASDFFFYAETNNIFYLSVLCIPKLRMFPIFVGVFSNSPTATIQPIQAIIYLLKVLNWCPWHHNIFTKNSTTGYKRNLFSLIHFLLLDTIAHALM